jgi:outer membrane protein TolC
MHRRTLALTLLVAAPSAAFAQTSQPQPPPAVATSLPTAPSVTDTMLGPVPPPKRTLGSWDEAVSYLRGRSTTLKTAMDQVLEAEAATSIALAQYLPFMGGCSGGSLTQGCANIPFTHQLLTNPAPIQYINGKPVLTGNALGSTVPIPNTLSAGVTLSQDILNISELDQIGISRLSELASRQTVDDTKRTLELALAVQVVSVVTAERSAELNRIGLKVALEQLELTRKKAADGAATGLDIVRAEQNAANARATLVAGDEALRQAREALGLALGIPEEIGVGPSLRIDGFATDALRSCHAVNDVDDRPDIASLHTSLEVAKRNLRNVWYTFLPTITASSSLSATTAVPSGYPNPTLSIGAVLTIPIWDGGTRLGNVKNARALEDVALEALDGAKRAAIIQVEQAQRGIEVAEVSLRVAGEQRDLAAKNDQMTQTAWMHGQGTSVDLVTASAAHRQAELTFAVAEFNVVKARLSATLALAICPW